MMKNSGGGVGFFGALQLLLVALKLMGYIGWSWLLVLLPMMCPVLALFAVMGLIVFLKVFEDLHDWLCKKAKD